MFSIAALCCTCSLGISPLYQGRLCKMALCNSAFLRTCNCSRNTSDVKTGFVTLCDHTDYKMVRIQVSVLIKSNSCSFWWSRFLFCLSCLYLADVFQSAGSLRRQEVEWAYRRGCPRMPEIITHSTISTGSVPRRRGWWCALCAHDREHLDRGIRHDGFSYDEAATFYKWQRTSLEYYFTYFMHQP